MPPTNNGDQPETTTIEQKLGPWRKPTKADTDRFVAAAKRVQAQMAAAGVTEEELVAEFERLRKAERERSAPEC